MALGISVKVGETSGSAGTSIVTGTAFIVGLTDWGPFTPQKVQSMGGYTNLYVGPSERTTTASTMYDSVETYFNLEGAAAYIQRAGKEVSAAAAKKELETASHAKTLVIEAKYRGVAGNKIKVAVVGEEFQVINEVTGEALETYTGVAKAETLKEKLVSSAYVVVKEGSEYAAGKTEALKAVASAALTGGTNPVSEQKLTEALAKEAIELLPKSLGPGQLIVPGREEGAIEEKTHIAMAEWALNSKTNRVALCDIADSATPATLITNKKTYASSLAGNMGFFSSSATIPGLTLGTSRTVPASAVAAALCAQAAKAGNDSAAPAGVQWTAPGQGLAPFVTGFTNTFSKSQMELLAENGINPFAERQGKPVLYDFVSALPKATDRIFYQLSASRERMHIQWAAEEIAETFLFKTIDGRGQLLAAFQGALMGMLKGQWEANAIFGATAQEASLVTVSAPENTLATESEGQLNAEIRVRLSPYVESMSLIVISSPITETV